MKNRISQKSKKFRRTISPVREIMNYADPNYIRSLGINPKELISFAGGWVNHKAPESLRNEYVNISNDSNLFHESGGYPPTLGNYEFKKAIIEFEKHIYGISDLNSNQIAVGLGSTQLTMDLFQVLMDPGDKLLLLDPSYCNFPTQLITGILDSKIIRFPVLEEDTWEYNANSKANEFREFIIRNKPKVILLISPDNPTSQVLSNEFVESTLSAAKEVGSFVVVDFAYKEIVFNDSYPDYFSWSPKDNFISLRSNSKWCRGLGRRLGWIEAPEFIIESMESIQNSTILCPDMLHQMALARYISNSINDGSLSNYLKDMRQMYKIAAEKTVTSIRKNLGFPVMEPEGGLYTCMRIDTDGAKFVENILKGCGVLVVPGRGFGTTLRKAVRISYGPLVNDLEKIEIGIKRMSEYLKK